MFNLINSNRGSLSWGLVVLFFFYDYLLKFSVSVFKPTLMQEFLISTTEFGLIMSMYMITYTVMQIPAGVMVDHWGPRKVITIAAIICGVGCLLFASANNFILLLIGRALIGCGASFALVTCSKLATIWFHSNKFASLFGFMVTVAFVGGVFGINISTFLISFCGWRRSMEVAGVLCLFIAFMMWWIIRDVRPAINKSVLPEKVSTQKLLHNLVKVVMDKQAWLSAMYAGFMFVPTTILAFWGPTYLSENNGLSLELAGGLTSTIFIGWMFGSPAYGFVSDFLGKRKLPMFFSAITTLLFSTMLIFNPKLSYIEITILMFLIGFSSSGFPLAFTALKENYNVALVGAAMGFINTINTLFEALSVIVVGKVIDLQLSSVMLENYQYAFMFVPASSLFALFMLFFIKAR
ncbi:unnamed protein product [Ectocarpus sp. 12 AP-2014]